MNILLRFGNLKVLFDVLSKEVSFLVALHEVCEFGDGLADEGGVCLSRILDEGYIKKQIDSNGDLIFLYGKNDKQEIVRITEDRIQSLLDFMKEREIPEELAKRKN
jgi:hypothetical protein